MNINITEDRITISANDIQNIKKVKYNSNSNYNSSMSEDDYIEISIFKDEGFHINKGYNLRTWYYDENMYSELVDEIKAKLKKRGYIGIPLSSQPEIYSESIVVNTLVNKKVMIQKPN